MREVKFRIWDNPTNKMYFDVLVGNCNGENTCPCVFINEKGWVHTDNCIIEQFTGLHDKNGVEIYEGDIVYGTIKGLLGQGYQNGIIKYGEYGFVIDLKKQSWEPGIGMVGFCSFEDYEVIGNIHERSVRNENNNQ